MIRHVELFCTCPERRLQYKTNVRGDADQHHHARPLTSEHLTGSYYGLRLNNARR